MLWKFIFLSLYVNVYPDLPRFCFGLFPLAVAIGQRIYKPTLRFPYEFSAAV